MLNGRINSNRRKEEVIKFLSRIPSIHQITIIIPTIMALEEFSKKRGIKPRNKTNDTNKYQYFFNV